MNEYQTIVANGGDLPEAGADLDTRMRAAVGGGWEPDGAMVHAYDGHRWHFLLQRMRRERAENELTPDIMVMIYATQSDWAFYVSGNIAPYVGIDCKTPAAAEERAVQWIARTRPTASECAREASGLGWRISYRIA